MEEGKRIKNPELIGANCKFAPAALNIFSANPKEQGSVRISIFFFFYCKVESTPISQIIKNATKSPIH